MRRIPRVATTALGAGLATAAGLLALAVPVGRSLDPLRGSPTWLTALVAAVALLLAVLRPPPRGGPVLWAVLGLVAAGGMAALALAVARNLARGGPTPGDAVLVVALAAAGFGALLLAMRGLRRAPAPRRGALVVLGTLTAFAVLAAAGALAGPDLPAVLASSTSDAPVAAGPVPSRPAAVRWTWAARDRVNGLTAGGPGVLVTDGDAVVGVDSVTGEERWRYRRLDDTLAGAESGQAVVTAPDGRTVVVTDRSGYAAVLDAVSGARRWRTDEDPLVITDRLVVTSAQGRSVVAHDVADGRVVWRRPEPAACDEALRAVVRSAGAAPLSCDDGTLHGLDENDGHERWVLPPPPPTLAREGEQPLLVRSTPSGRTVLFGRLITHELQLVDPVVGAVRAVAQAEVSSFAGDTDARPALVDPGYGDDGRIDPARPPRGVDPLTGETFALPAAACSPYRTEALRLAGGATASLCGGSRYDDAPLAVRTTDGATIPLTPPPAPAPTGDPPSVARLRLLAAPGAVVAAVVADDASGGAVVGLN